MENLQSKVPSPRLVTSNNFCTAKFSQFFNSELYNSRVSLVTQLVCIYFHNHFCNQRIITLENTFLKKNS